MTTITELIPTNGRKSFYNKAKVVDKNGNKYLLSYSTIVAGTDKNGNVRRYWSGQTNTTSCHIKSFIETFGNGEIDHKSFKDLPVMKTPELDVAFS